MGSSQKAQESNETERNNSGKITQKVEIKQDYVENVKVPDTIKITNGQLQQAHIYAGVKRQKDQSAKEAYWQVLDGLESTSSNEKVDKMSSDGIITPYGSGTTITVTINGHSYSFQVEVQGDTHTHTWDEGKIIKKATCSESGIKTYTCASCGETKTEEIPALGHGYGNWTTLDAKQHQRACKNDNSHVEKEDHEFDEGVITKEPTYTKEGEKTYTCKDCGYKKIEIMDKKSCSHKYNVTVNKKATCNKDGLETFTCSICGDTFTQKLPALGHDYDEGKIIVLPTGSTKGLKEYTCKKCGDTKSEELNYDATNHTADQLETINQKTATTTSEGYTGDVVCKACGTIVSQGNIIPKIAQNVDQADPSNTTNSGTSDPTKRETNQNDINKNTSDANKKEENNVNSGAFDSTTKKDESSHVTDTVLDSSSKTNDSKNDMTPKVTSKQKDVSLLNQGIVAETQMIRSLKNDQDLKGTTYRQLRLQMTKRTTQSLKLSWKKVAKAKTYLVYGNKCGMHYRFLKKTNRCNYVQNKLKKGTYYKYMIVVLDQKGRVLARSKIVHMATRGGHYGNVKSIKAKKKITLKRKQTYQLSYQVTYDAEKVKTHRKITLESENNKIVRVKKGKLIGKTKGTTYIYIYAQDGVASKVKVKVMEEKMKILALFA